MWTQVASKMRPAVTGLGPIGPYGRAAMAGDTKHKQQLGVYPNGKMFHLDGPFPMSKQKQPNIHVYIYIYVYNCIYYIYIIYICTLQSHQLGGVIDTWLALSVMCRLQESQPGILKHPEWLTLQKCRPENQGRLAHWLNRGNYGSKMINRPEWVNAKTKHVVGPLVPNFDPYPYGCRVRWIPNWRLFWFFSRHGLLIHITIVGYCWVVQTQIPAKSRSSQNPVETATGCSWLYHVSYIFISWSWYIMCIPFVAGCPFPIYQAAKFSSTAPSQSHHLSRAPVAQSARNLAAEPSQAAVIKRQWTACWFYSFLENKTNEWYGSL